METVVADFLKSKIAIIGGGNFCRNLLAVAFRGRTLTRIDPPLWVSPISTTMPKECCWHASWVFRQHRLPRFFQIPDLQTLMELTPDFGFSAAIGREKPAGVKLIDHIEARSVWSSLQLEKAQHVAALKELHANNFSEHDHRSCIQSLRRPAWRGASRNAGSAILKSREI